MEEELAWPFHQGFGIRDLESDTELQLLPSASKHGRGSPETPQSWVLTTSDRVARASRLTVQNCTRATQPALSEGIIKRGEPRQSETWANNLPTSPALQLPAPPFQQDTAWSVCPPRPDMPFVSHRAPQLHWLGLENFTQWTAGSHAGYWAHYSWKTGARNISLNLQHRSPILQLPPKIGVNSAREKRRGGRCRRTTLTFS